MKRKYKFDESGDSDELQALFDSMAVEGGRQGGRKPAAGKGLQSPLGGVVQPATEGDTPELEALFDSVAVAAGSGAQAAGPSAPVAGADAGDSPELEALFDGVMSAVSAPPVRGSLHAVSAVRGNVGDSPELESLFEAVASEARRATQQEAGGAGTAGLGSDSSPALYERLGLLTRELHDTLRALGHADLIRETAAVIPDAGDRLEYVTRMTEQAAARTLNAVDMARPIVQSLHARTQQHRDDWDRAIAGAMSADDFRALAHSTRDLLADLPSVCDRVDWQFHEITMAQDFQDLTGQVIKKLVSLVRQMERDLVGVLVQSVPEGWMVNGEQSLLNGPVIDPRADDVVTNQQQVDDLLESLGF